MASSAQIAPHAAPEVGRDPLTLWHLLSLDAPSVAALWAWFVARACGIRLAPAAPLAMFLAVWILYAADRLLDARLLLPILETPRGRLLAPALPALEARHRFHHRHRLHFAAGILGAAVVLGTLLPHLYSQARVLFSMEGALLFAWFLLLHAAPPTLRLPKELVVGLFFAAAIFTPAVARRPELWRELTPHAALFAAVCMLNCTFIHVWEHGGDEGGPAHRTTRFVARHVVALTVVEVVCAALVGGLAAGPVRMVAWACGVSGGLLLLLHTQRERLPRTRLRAAADLTLLTPLLLLPLLG